MPGRTIVGIFDSTRSAERARSTLVRAGIPSERLALSTHLTADAIAAEAPGQSYEHQSFANLHGGSEWERYNTALRGGTCILSVTTESVDERRQAEQLMRRSGARGTAMRPDDAIL